MEDTEKNDVTARTLSPANEHAFKTGNLEFVAEQGENGSAPTYQEASGAPVESHSPLGHRVTWYTIVFLNIGQMIGTGVFSTPGSILVGVGSVGLSLFYWFIGFVVSLAGLAVYLELASYFPSRSGGEVVYLEQAYPRPKYFFPVAFAVQTVILSFSSSNAIVFSTYIFRMAGRAPSDWELKGVAIAGYSAAVILGVISNRWSLFFSNAIGVVKVTTLVFISLTGLIVLGGHTSVADPGLNFRDAFYGTRTDANGLVNALVRITFSYQGFQNCFNMMNEIKDPVQTVKKAAPAALTLTAVLYMLCNIAYFAAVPREDILTADTTTASLFFGAVFGTQAAKGLNMLVILSAFGNLVTVLIGQSRVIREIGRQGVLPYPKFWVTTKPFGTPIGPYMLKWAMTILMIVAPPAGDAFDFVVDLQNYPESMFFFLMAAGIYLIRRQRNKLGLGRSEFRAWDVAIGLFILVKVLLLIMPWVPPEGGATGGSVSFWYATYCVAGIGIILLCGVYYVFWINIIPKWKGYAIRQQRIVYQEDSAVTHKLVRVPQGELEKWDAEHDVNGNKIL
ncbi:hypothetical protein Q7P37_006160 [Cladosporium fusiforme]